MKKDNKGFSLVELLVAITIAAIVSGSVGYLLTTSLRMYGKETTDVALQQELQTTLNQVVDYAMESQTVVLSNSGGAGSETTDYLCLGTIDSTDQSKLKAQIFFQNDNKLYMCKTDIANYTEVLDSEPRNLDEKVSSKVSGLLSGDLNSYLLAEYVDNFYVKLEGTDDSGTDKVFDNPLSLAISIQFSKNVSGKTVTKSVNDKVALRNRIKTDIYYNGLAYSRRASSESDSLKVETTTVQNEKMLGKIEYTHSGARYKGNLNILEIVPDYSYDEVQYVIGGNNGALLNYENTTYGASAPANAKITCDELDAAICYRTGSYGNGDDVIWGSLASNYYPNGGNVPAMIFNPYEYVGYYEYVGAANGGVYAYDSCKKSSDESRIEEVHMYSKYYSGTPSDVDYGWVWREATGDLYSNIVNGTTYTSSSVIDQKKYKSSSSQDEKRIYLRNHKKVKGFNNDTFKMYTMIDVMEGYVPSGSLLDTKYGRYDVIGTSGSSAQNVTDHMVQPHSINGAAIKKWEDAGNKIMLNVRTPGDLKDTDISSADMIIFAIAGDGGFDWAHITYSSLKNSIYNVGASTQVSYTSDITFKQAVDIYTKVVNLESCIACPTAFQSIGGAIGQTNMAKMYYMLYGMKNESVELSKIKDDTYLNKKNGKINDGKNYWASGANPNYLSKIENVIVQNGSGRELFKDYLKSFAGKELSKSLYEEQKDSEGTIIAPRILPYKTTDILYIDESNGDVVIPAQLNKTIEGITYNYTEKRHSIWSQGDFSGNDFYAYGNERYGAIDKPQYLHDIYSSASGKASYIHNEDKSYDYKFTYGAPYNDSLYLNQLTYNQGSQLMNSFTDGSHGVTWLQTIRTSTTPDGDQTSSIGDIYVVGAGDRYGPTRDESSSKTYGEWNVKYRNMPVKSLSNAKIIYLSEAEYEDAQTNGLDVYSIVSTSEEFTVVNEAKHNHLIEARMNPYTYHAGTETNERFVYEYDYHIDPLYFQHFGKPVNDGNYMFTVKIKAQTEDGQEYNGKEDFYIVIRDEFDLD